MRTKMTSKQIALRLKNLNKINPYYKIYSNAIDAINREFFTTQLARQGLYGIREACKIKDASVKFSIQIPNTEGNTIRQERRKSHIVEILKKTIRHDLYAASINNLVSITEQYLCDLLESVLKKHPQKLSLSITDEKTDKKTETSIPMSQVLSASSISEIINSLIVKRISSIFYASPDQYFSYFAKIVDISIDQGLIDQYIEIKATRDLLVHNKGKVNNIYIGKCKKNARVTDTKQNIPLSEEYYIKSASAMKKIIRVVHEKASRKQLKLTKRKDIFLYSN
ncbi:MAG: hypothetical protein J6B07_07215 [Opitutales bacterium]|nr:hypothetical protein [Opitutales bacterium]